MSSHSANSSSSLTGNEKKTFLEMEYQKFKNGDYKLFVRGGFSCPFCHDRKKTTDSVGLLTHSSVIANSTSDKWTFKDKANHRALAKWLVEDYICQPNKRNIDFEDYEIVHIEMIHPKN